jgi:putative PEP-CTERM system TPR-repeat lipoprotein
MATVQIKQFTWSKKWMLGGAGLAGAAAVTLVLAVLMNRPSLTELRGQAAAYQQRGDYNAAIIVLKQAIQASPKDAQVRFDLARVYLESGDSEFAEKEVRMAQKLGYPAGPALPVLARALLLQAEYQKALDETEAAAAGGAPEVLAARGDALQGLGKRELARQVYEAVLQASPKALDAMIGLGRLAMRSGQADEAHALAARALALQPNSTAALLFQADLFRAGQRNGDALRTYDRILAINPGHRSARIVKADLEITLGRYEAAQKNLDTARKQTPGSILLAYTQSLLYFSQGKNQLAQESIQKLLRAAPEHMPSVLLAGAIDLNLDSLYQAENHFRHYLQSDPGNVYARKMLAASLLRSGHATDALSVLEPALKTAGRDVQLMALAGETYLQARNYGKAIELFQQASALAPEAANLRTSLGLSRIGKGELENAIGDLRAAADLDHSSSDAGVALVRTELSLKRYDRALAAVNALERAQPRSATVADLKGTVHAGQRDLGRARASFRQALALQPDYFPAAAHLAELDLNSGNPAGARQHLAAFLEKNKTSVEALTAMATVAEREGKPQDATPWLERAAAVAPMSLGPAVNLIGQYLRTGQTDKALVRASQLQVAHPGNPDLLDLLGKGQMANGQLEAALATYKQLTLALPRSAQARMQVAALQLVLKNTTGAEVTLKEVLAIQPDFPAAQLALAELYVRKGWHELAAMMAARMQRHHPDASAGYQLEGDILMAQQRAAQAATAYQRAFLFTRNAELTIKISHALRHAGKGDQARARVEQWLRDHPDDVRVQLYRASTLMGEKQHAQAAAQLEAVLARHPQHVVALNNLALAYQHMKDPRARQVAERAYALAADQAGIIDTLAWILVEQGETARGLALLKDAQARAPEARDIRYHLAVALSRSGDTEGARKILHALLSEKARFPEADNARLLLSQLK